MDMNEYQKKAASTAIYPGAGTGGLQALAYLGLGLGEAGEIQGKIKKIMRDEPGMEVSDYNRVELMKELGDLQWYVALLAAELGTTLEAIATLNLTKLADRRERGVLTGSGDNR